MTIYRTIGIQDRYLVIGLLRCFATYQSSDSLPSTKNACLRQGSFQEPLRKQASIILMMSVSTRKILVLDQSETIRQATPSS